jgi:hypothetical protein
MPLQADIKNRFIGTLDHIDAVVIKLRDNTGNGRTFTFPDHHKLCEGLFLNCWTHWEEFIRELLIADLATSAQGFVRRDVREFRLQGAPQRLAEAILFHPDHPEKFVEWDYSFVRSRADTFLSAGHRFSLPLPRFTDLDLLKRIRNAIAHKSDRAWGSFLSMARQAPFNLAPAQMKGISSGRFIAAHNWNGHPVLEETVIILRSYATHLVP